MILYDSDSDDELEIVTIASMEAEIYPPKLFRRRFRMNRSLFLRIKSEVEAYEPYFVQKRNGARVLGLSSLQKITAALRMLAYGVAPNFMDEYLRIGESAAMKSLKKFVKAVVSIFSDEYLRSLNNDGIARILAIGESRGFPGMLGSIDSFFGLPESNNDINLLERSSVFTELAQGCAPRVNYTINGNEYTMGYYLVDGIYLQWATFVKTIPCPQGKKNKHFAEAQEAYRNDVDRAFRVLEARFAIVHGPVRPWDLQTLKDIMKAYIIPHNMIIEDERDGGGEQNIDYEQIDKIPHAQVSLECTPDIMEFIQQHRRIRDRETHSRLQSDLVEHLWQIYSQS
ncbi:uncharacterized protein LOC114296126 [Camellia sinensis]|uniref:uncharacterized protein LOC114296126 n=1 Tax=Camellia sinensis TaxID=4442 RepID=UPI001036419A|nr:uncharacterized protein LOC114296126 [Camellia sinensis]